MPASVLDYFAAEKNEAALFMAIGVAAIGLSIYLYLSENAYRTIAFPLVAIAVIQLLVGGSVFFRTDDQVDALAQEYEASVAAYTEAEIARMEPVMKNFQIYKSIEIVLLLSGIILSFLFRHNMTWYAISIGLIAQSAIMLVLDLFAERRGDLYLEFLRQLSSGVSGA